MGTEMLSGRVALVTGGSRGIGAAICQRLAANGAAVVVSYLSNHQAAEEVAAKIRGSGRRVLLAPGDVRDPGIVQRVVGRAERAGSG